MSDSVEPRPPPARVGSRAATRETRLQQRRQALVAAALRVIARKGLTGLTMNDIAVEAKCAYGVVAFHFKSKEGITLAALDSLVEDYDAALRRRAHGTPEARLRSMIDLDFDSAVSSAESVAVFTAFWAESARNPDYARRCAELKARYDAAVAADVAALAERTRVALDPALVARSLNALIDGLWISGQVFGRSAEAHGLGKRACLFYLASLFPGCF